MSLSDLAFADQSDIASIPLADDHDDRSQFLPYFSFDPDLNANIYKDSSARLSNSCRYYSENEFASVLRTFNTNSNSFLHLNVRGMASSYNELEAFITQHHFTFVGLCETFLSEHNSALFHFTGYHVVHKTRPHNQRGGGVSILAKNSINFSERNDLSSKLSVAESIFIEIPKSRTNEKKMIIAEIYRPPQMRKSTFIDELDDIMSIIDREGALCYLLGDFNIDLMKIDTDAHSADYINMFYRHCLFPLINRPTRLCSGSLIDHIFTNSHSCINEGKFLSVILLSDFSDHCPIIHVCETSTMSQKSGTPGRPRYQLINDRTITALRVKLASIDWSDVLGLDSVDDSYNIFLEKFSHVYFQCIPVIERKAKNIRKPWITDELLVKIKEKNRLYALMRRNPCTFTREIYRTCKNQLNHLLRASERKYAHDHLNNQNLCSKRQWKVINTLIERKHIDPLPSSMRANQQSEFLNDPILIANGLNHYFVNSGGAAIENNTLTALDPLSFVPNISESSNMYVQRVNREELLGVLASLKRTSSGVDGLRPGVVRDVRHELIVPLLHWINLSIKNGCFPSKLKEALITPIHKKGDKTLMTNYRPISVLNVFAKVLEKIIYKRLISYLIGADILYRRQFGFRKGHSTEMAITEAVSVITKSLNQKTPIIAVNMDLSKAFDTIDHIILCKKLEKYGITRNIQDWFVSYLSNRVQKVRIGQNASSSLPVLRGVPQGSTLGPLLFLIYINDIYRLSSEFESILYADDCNIFFKATNLNVSAVVNSSLEMLSNWFACNQLALNTTKTNYMIFSGRRRFQVDNISINGTDIHKVSQCRFLGIVLDDKLSWRPHIQFALRKISRSIGILRKVNRHLSRNFMLQLYNSFILPYLQYGITAWGSASKTSVNSLFLYQKKAIKVALNVPTRTSTTEIFENTKFLSIFELYKLYVAIFMFRFQNSFLPPCFDQYFVSHTHSHGTRNSSNYVLPLFSTNYCQQSILFQGPKLWSTLPYEIRTSSSLPIFKKQLRRYLLDLQRF